MSPIALISRVLRDPVSLLDANEAEYAPRITALLAILGTSAALFGAVVGGYRGGLQTVYAGIKMPMLFLVPGLVALPALHALWGAVGSDVPMRRVALGTLVASTRTAILAAALSPVLWLLYSLHVDYHLAVLLLAAFLGLAAAPSVPMLRNTGSGPAMARLAVLGGSAALLGLLTMQTGWLLRPFVARPTTEVTFLRTIESDVFSSLGHTAGSSQGIYTDWEPSQDGFLNGRREEPTP